MILSRKLKNARLILSEDLFFIGLRPKISDNFILSASPKILWAGTPMSVRNFAYFRYGNPILIDPSGDLFVE